MGTARVARQTNPKSQSTIDSAISVLELLTEEGQKKVLNFSIGLLQDEDDNPFKPVTKEEILAELDASEGDIRAGRTKDAHQAMSDIKVRLGMPL